MTGERKAEVAIDLSGVTSGEHLHLILMDALDFPGYYGCNWNAFWDAISAIVRMPKVLHLRGYDKLIDRLPHDELLMWECLEDLAAQYPEDAPEIEYVC